MATKICQSEQCCTAVPLMNRYYVGFRIILNGCGGEGAMHSAIRITFPHRLNADDGTYDSICTACFATVGTDRDETKLRTYELAHACDPFQALSISRDRVLISFPRRQD